MKCIEKVGNMYNMEVYQPKSTAIYSPLYRNERITCIIWQQNSPKTTKQHLISQGGKEGYQQAEQPTTSPKQGTANHKTAKQPTSPAKKDIIK